MSKKQNGAKKDPFSILNKDQQTLIRLDFERNHSNKEIASLIGVKQVSTVSHWRDRDWYEPAFNYYASKAVKGKYKSKAIQKLVELLDAKSEMVQLQSATTLLKMAGMLSDNDTPELTQAKVRKANADARVAEAKAKTMEDNGQDVELLITKMMDKVAKEDSNDES